MADNTYHIIMQFGVAIPGSVQGEAMLMLEKWFRAKGFPAEVFKNPMGDDIKLRRSMTPEQRAKL